MSKSNFRLGKVIEKTDGFSGAELKATCVEAGMIAIRESRTKVTQNDILKAIERVLEKRRPDRSIDVSKVLYG